jgi:hypothetical protein
LSEVKRRTYRNPQPFLTSKFRGATRNKMKILPLNHGHIIPFMFFLFNFPRSSFAFDLAEWLNNPPYENGGTPKEQIRCYALPFGAIGFSSHVLTYLTVLCLAKGRSPWWPWKKLQWREFNLVIASLGLLITIPMTVLTMLRCRNRWSFILIAVWKLVLAVTLSAMSIHAARLIQPPRRSNYGDEEGYDDSKHLLSGASGVGIEMSGRNAAVKGPNSSATELDVSGSPETAKKQTNHFGKIWWWSLFYFLGSIVGFVGVMNLVKHDFSRVWELRTVTYVFMGVAFGIPLLLSLLLYCTDDRSASRLKSLYSTFMITLFYLLVFLTILFAFYTDWVLASLAGDFVGWPSSENAVFYWTYFAAKRFPIASL